MEVRGHILPAPGTYSPAGSVPGRLQELRERQRGLRQALGLRLRELRRLCLQEAELTGKLPPEFPLEPGERPQPPPRRRAGVPSRGPPPEVCRARREAQAQAQVQAQVLEAARRLAAVPGLPPEQRRRRLRLQAEAAQRLRQLRAQLGTPDENGSLSELPALENGAPPPPKPPPGGPGRPSPPRAGSSSPDRRPPPPWTPDVPPGRRSSLASPASPARTLPRSASSFEGRSVPATPVLARSPRGAPQNRPDAPGLPPRPWSGSQDSQLGGPAAPPGPPIPGAPRTRRSNSSEALIDWGCSGGAPSETPTPPLDPSSSSSSSSRLRGGAGGGPGGCAPPSAEQRRSQKWLALEGLRDWYLRHAGTPPQPPAHPGWAQPPPPQRRRDPPGLPHSLSYAGALPRTPGDTPGTTPPPPLDPQPPGTLV